MRSNSESKKQRGAVLSALVVLLWLAGLVAVVIFAAAEAAREGAMGVGALLVLLYGTLGGVAMVGILIALRQRLKEIKEGEEDDASQY